uniref:Retrotransposon Copia-like N-terminal domain-containing protein n=1 Tax=Lactuca sativa TaxID=4236 RepID=A0A9R1VR19_LACSA|nr:hypothetical protein LSAT_V11C400204230 [Lactuca sativa]
MKQCTFIRFFMVNTIMTGEKPEARKKGEDVVNANSSYYVHPFDYQKHMQVNDLLNNKNFNEWKQEMTNFLYAKNKIGLKPESTSPMYMAWMRADAMIRERGAPRAYELKQSLNATRQDGTSISSYYMKLKGVWDGLQLVLHMPCFTCSGCSCALGKSSLPRNIS